MAKSDPPLQVVASPELRDRIMAIAIAEELSQAQVVRDILMHGIGWREGLSARRTRS